MRLDENLLPWCGSDKQDQLQRTGMILLAAALGANVPKSITSPVSKGFSKLEPWMGIFTRHPGANPFTTSGDQLCPLICWETVRAYSVFLDGLANHYRYFAPNVADTDPKKPKWKMPDFVFFRFAPLFNRFTKWRHIADLCLVAAVLIDRLKTDREAEPNNLVATLLTCDRVSPTFISKWTFSYAKKHNNLIERLRWCHRAEEPANGNPDIAEYYVELINS